MALVWDCGPGLGLWPWSGTVVLVWDCDPGLGPWLGEFTCIYLEAWVGELSKVPGPADDSWGEAGGREAVQGGVAGCRGNCI